MGKKESRLEPLPAHYECAVSGCWALHGRAIPAYTKGFQFPVLLTIAERCVRVRVKHGRRPGHSRAQCTSFTAFWRARFSVHREEEAVQALPAPWLGSDD